MHPSLFFYPEAISWMWNYCLPLGKFTHNNVNYDLGVYVHGNDVSFAVVYGNEPGSYLSGDIDMYSIWGAHNPVHQETIRRFKIFKGELV